MTNICYSSRRQKLKFLKGRVSGRLKLRSKVRFFRLVGGCQNQCYKMWLDVWDVWDVILYVQGSQIDVVAFCGFYGFYGLYKVYLYLG